MESRFDEKKVNTNDSLFSRAKRNKVLYEKIDNIEIEHIDVKNNATILDENNSGNIDVDKIKSILDNHYKDTTKSPFDVKMDPIPSKKDETKEYDINVIIDKAKEEKKYDYNVDRIQRLHNTQYEILNDLNMEDNNEDFEKQDKTTMDPETLKTLIDTIKLNEKEIMDKKNKITEENTTGLTDPLDLYEDLKGSEDTKVTGVIDEDTSELFTEKNTFKEKDFETLEVKKIDDDNDEPKSNAFIKILILILLAIFVFGIVVLIKSFL